MGYSGGVAADPTYEKVCRNADFNDYAEAIQIDYDPTHLTYEALLEFYFNYDGAVQFPRTGVAPSRKSTAQPVARRLAKAKRQYAPVIFTHDATQRAIAESALAQVGECATVVEDLYQGSGKSFWTGEPYHQKWKLQKRTELMTALALPDEEALIDGRAATALNAFAGGARDAAATRQRLRLLVEQGYLGAGSCDAVTKLLEGKPVSAPGAWRR